MQKPYFLAFCICVLQFSAAFSWDTTTTAVDASSTTYKVQQTLSPMQIRGVNIQGTEIYVIPLSYSRSGNLIISTTHCEGDPTTFAVVSTLDMKTADTKQLQKWTTIGNSITRASLKVETDSGSQGLVYLLVKLVNIIDQESHSFTEFRTTLSTSKISPEKVFQTPESFEIGWGWNENSGKLVGSWPVLEANSDAYEELLLETSKSDQLSVVYKMIATKYESFTEGMAKCDMKVKGQTGLVEVVKEISLPDSKNVIDFEFEPKEKIYYLTIVATVSKAFWNNSSKKSWEIHYIYPILKYEVPAQYLSGYQEKPAVTKPMVTKPVQEPNPENLTTNMLTKNNTVQPSKPIETSSQTSTVDNTNSQTNETVVSATPNTTFLLNTDKKSDTQVNPNFTEHVHVLPNTTETQPEIKIISNETSTEDETQSKTNETATEDKTIPNNTTQAEIHDGNSTKETSIDNNGSQITPNTTERSESDIGTKEKTTDHQEINEKPKGLSSTTIFWIVVVVIVLLVAFSKMRESRREQKQKGQMSKNPSYFENESTYFELSNKRNRIDV